MKTSPADAYSQLVARARAALRRDNLRGCFDHLERAHLLSQRDTSGMPTSIG
jgi:hypothetical protein